MNLHTLRLKCLKQAMKFKGNNSLDDDSRRILSVAKVFCAFVIPDLKDGTIDELMLTKRAENNLKAADIFTIADLMAKSELELSCIDNMGRKSLEEIRLAVNAIGLILRAR